MIIYQDYVHAARYFNKGCWLEDGVSCGLLGKLYYSGEGVFQSYFEAENYFLKGCNLQDGFACRSLGELYYSGESEGLKQNYVEAVKYYSKGCDLNDGVSCGALGLLYYKGLGVAQNYSMAAMYCRKGCELQDGSACGLLGGLYYLGGKEVFHDYDYTKAAEYLAAGCKLQGNIPYDISVLILKNAEYHKDDQIYKYICELKHAPACIYLANLYEQDQRMKQKYYKSAYYYVKGIKLMTHEERIEFFSELLRKNKDMNIRLNDFQQMQLEIEVLRASILENEN